MKAKEEPVNGTEPEPAAMPQPKCGFCRASLEQIGWLKNEQEGLVTFFHNVPGCMKVINIQAVPVQQRVIQPPAGLIRQN